MITVKILEEKPLEVKILNAIVEKELIPEGYYKVEGTKTITENGTHNVGDYEFAIVNVPERKEEQEKTVEITENGTTEILPDGDKVISKATVNVNVPIPDGYIKPEGSIDITENGSFDVTEKAEVNVQVVAKPKKPYIDSSKIQNFSKFFSLSGGAMNDISLLPFLDTSNGVNFSDMFRANNTDIIEVPQLDTSKGINVNSMFYNAKVVNVPSLNLSNATDAYGMFFNTYWLESCGFLDMRNCTRFRCLFFQSAVKTIEGIRTDNGTDFNQFLDSSQIVSIGGELDFSKATDYTNAFRVGNLKDIRFSAINVFNSSLNFSRCSKLTEESLLSILNALSDNTELDTTYTVTLGSANLAKLTVEQKKIAYNKNIELA